MMRFLTSVIVAAPWWGYTTVSPTSKSMGIPSAEEPFYHSRCPGFRGGSGVWALGRPLDLVAQLCHPRPQVPALGGRGSEAVRPLIERKGIRPASEPPQQIGPGRMQQVVALELTAGAQLIDEFESRG